MLRISRELFRSIYAGTTILDYEDLFYSTPVDNEDLFNNYLPSKLWRLNNLYTIIDTRGNTVKFNMNVSQHKVYAKSLLHKRLIILKSRQQGISTLWLVSFFDDCCTVKNYSIGLMAQGQDEASTLLQRVKILWDNTPQEFKNYLNLSIAVDNTKALSLSNGSSIFVRTSFRSTTLQRLHISEMGKIANKYPEKARETKTGTLQAIAPGNTTVIESTAEGDNLFKEMWDKAVQYSGELSAKDFLPVFLSWIDDPDCTEPRRQVVTDKQEAYFARLEKELNCTLTEEQKNFWVVQHRELGDTIYQEYPSTPIEAFMTTKDGTYYARLYMEYVKAYKREVNDLYDPNLNVQIAADLGMDDTMVLTVFQEMPLETRIIDEIYDNGQPISYYTNILKKKPYFNNFNYLILPHDAAVRELTSGKSRLESFEEELPGVVVEVLPKVSTEDGINAVKELIKRLWIDTRCQYLISCFFNYRKEFDEKRNRWRDKPYHDEYSNGADSIRYVAMGRRVTKTITKIKRSKGFDV